tara:strand:- start:15180 stop:15752 length:573 start_codon:yes stop_codon:yes gene_type:complete
MTNQEYSYIAEKEVRTYAYLFRTAQDSLARAEANEEGRFYQIMSSLVFSAFALEAFFNHLGEIEIECWGEIERIGPAQKLNVLYHHLNLDFSASNRPIQTVTQLLRFKTFMAHGRTERLKTEGVLSTPRPDPGQSLIDGQWEKFCNVDEARRGLHDVKEVIETMAGAANIGGYSLFSLGHQSHSIGLTEP